MIDTHCHLDFPEFDVDRDQVVHQCLSRGLERIIVPGVCATTWHRLRAVTQRYAICREAYGMHPMFIEEHQPSHLDKLVEIVALYQPCAIGEIGLDFYLTTQNAELQTEFFVKQIEIAKEFKLPIILHVRKAHDEVLKWLKQCRFQYGGSVHAFSGSLSQAKRYLDFGFKLGFGGAITFERATRLRQLLKDLDDGDILLETDAPDMAPAMHSSKRNNPAYLPDILAVISEIRGQPAQQLQIITNKNAKQLFFKSSSMPLS